jgi:cyclohexadieny/prephenate dehydrogenase
MAGKRSEWVEYRRQLRRVLAREHGESDVAGARPQCAAGRSVRLVDDAHALEIARAILSHLNTVKRPALDGLGASLRPGVHLVPAHPIAGTENSGPESGFAELFKGRWCIVTPVRGTPKDAARKVEAFWKRIGSKTARMTPAHHDRVLAITSHVPHLIAYTIVNTASDLESTLRAEVIKYSASGFRDFTRVAASHPVMWRDVFLANKDAVLEMMGRLYEDIATMQKAIRHDEGATLERLFAKARKIRRSIVQAKQA